MHLRHLEAFITNSTCIRCDSAGYSNLWNVRRRSCSCSGAYRFHIYGSKRRKLFVNSPNALEGNEISKCNTASAEYQSKTAGLVDGIGAEAEILGQIRDLVCSFRQTTKMICLMRNAQMT